MKGKALRKHSLHGKTAASVLLKLFISGNERCHTTDKIGLRKITFCFCHTARPQESLFQVYISITDNPISTTHQQHSMIAK